MLMLLSLAKVHGRQFHDAFDAINFGRRRLADGVTYAAS